MAWYSIDGIYFDNTREQYVMEYTYDGKQWAYYIDTKMLMDLIVEDQK